MLAVLLYEDKYKQTSKDPDMNGEADVEHKAIGLQENRVPEERNKDKRRFQVG